MNKLRSRSLGAIAVRPRKRRFVIGRNRGARSQGAEPAEWLRTLYDTSAPPSLRDDAAARLVTRFLGLELSETVKQKAAAMRRDTAVGRLDDFDLAAAVGLFVLRTVGEGRCVHVLDMGLRAHELADRLGPMLDEYGLIWACQNTEATARERAEMYNADVLFGRPQQVALDVLLSRHLGDAPRGRLRGGVSRLMARLDVSPGPRTEAMDVALILDGESALCERALTGVVASEVETQGEATFTAEEALGVAAQMEPADFRLSKNGAELTRQGRRRLATMSGTLGPDWNNAALGELAVCRALMALHLWREGEHFLRENDKIVPLAPELSGESDASGLAPINFLRIKERMEPEENRRSVHRTTLRSFFTRYRKLAAMVDAAPLYRRELKAVHGLKTERGRITWPQLYCHDVTDLPAMLAKRATGPVLPVVLGRTEEEMLQIADALRDVPLFDADALPSSAMSDEHVEIRSGLLWMGRPDPAALARLVDEAGTLCLPVLIGASVGWWCRAQTQCCTVILPASTASTRRAWRKLSVAAASGRWPARTLHRLHGRWYIRNKVRKDAGLRQMLAEFDKRARESVSFLHTHWE